MQLIDRLQPIAQALLALATDIQSGERTAQKARDLERLARDLAAGLDGNLRRFSELDERLRAAHFMERILDLPLQLSRTKQTEAALSVARSFAFIAPDMMRGDEAVILASAGRKAEALTLVASNLERAKDIPTAEGKAGDAYRALGEIDAAEAYYRRSLAEAESAIERSEAMLRLVSLLSDAGREPEAALLLREERQRLAARH
jgi:hypothetical protein